MKNRTKMRKKDIMNKTEMKNMNNKSEIVKVQTKMRTEPKNKNQVKK